MPLFTRKVTFATTSTQKATRKRSRPSAKIYILDLLEQMWNTYCSRFRTQMKVQETKKHAINSEELKLLENKLFSHANSDRTFSVRSLLECLLLGNWELDSASWLIVFALFDRLISRLNASLYDDGTCFFNIFYPEYSVHTLFTLYCISFKWHLDYTISLKYLVDLLPCTTESKKTILLATGAVEQCFLSILDYHCNVTRKDILELLELSLLPEESSALSTLLL